MAAAAASWMSTRSISESSPLGVSVLISGATTEIDPSLPGRFSFPPTREGRAGLALLPVVVESSGVSEPLRLSAVTEPRGRFCPAVDLGATVDFCAGAAACFCDFFDGASG